MPSITSYSHYATLAFFQSIAQYGSNASSLQEISALLKHNEFISHSPDFNVNRFSVDALQVLYNQHLASESDDKNHVVNGVQDIEERSPKRRKLSDPTNSHEAAPREAERELSKLIEHLYSQYKDEAVYAIKRDEEAFDKLQDEISALEAQIKMEKQHSTLQQTQSSDSVSVDGSSVPLASHDGSKIAVFDPKINRPTLPPKDLVTPKIRQASQTDTQISNTQSLQARTDKSNTTGDVAQSQPATTPLQDRTQQASNPVPTQHPSPGLFPRQLPSPAPQRPNQGPIQGPSMYQSGQSPPPHLMPQLPNSQQRPVSRTQQASSQGRGSPVPYQGQHQYAPYPQYPPAPPPPPQWHPHMTTQQYQPHMPYGPPPTYYSQSPHGRHSQTPQQIPFPQYPHTAPIHYAQPQQQQWRSQQWPAHSGPTVTTPISRPNSRLSLQNSGSSTPWRRKQLSNQHRQRTPPPPAREVSPLSDREISPVPKALNNNQGRKVDIAKKSEELILTQPPPPRRRGRPPSVTPSAIGQSRSQSIASVASDVQNEKQNVSRRGQRIKAEPPSTPLHVPASDTEQRSSGRRGRPRSSTLTSQADGSRVTAFKRKRMSPSPSSPIRSSPPHSFAMPQARRLNQSHDPALIMVSKNFSKTSQLLLNEITSHKLAGIFAKPLSERDAPGYKDLILRPQDLKNIKAAVSKGGRAALAVVEAVEVEHDATPTRTHPSPVSAEMGSIGNGFYLVPTTSELVPPRGIVNSAQLEMELVRMFANAVMFNPLPDSERGFGRSLRLRRNGGGNDADADSEPSISEGSETESIPGTEEGGIISDAREMFSDVVEVVAKWRELEGERMNPPADISLSRHASLAMHGSVNLEHGRHPSVSASSHAGDEDTAAGESEAASTPIGYATSGPGRKRRKVVEH